MKILSLLVIMLLLSIVFETNVVRAENPGNITQFVWLGKTDDKVGTGDAIVADGIPDYTFQVKLNLPVESMVESFDVYLCDAQEAKFGEYWLSKDYQQVWILGAFHQGNLLNPKPGMNLGKFTGEVIFDLHGNDSGRIEQGSNFLLEAVIDGKKYTKKLIADKPTAPLTVTKGPAGNPGILLDTTNKAAVQNVPLFPTFLITEPHKITFIMTYHYLNMGNPPGTIALRHADGTVYGPWKASGRDGQGGVVNANWDVRPGVVIKAGLYTIIDSDPNTWSTNIAAKLQGHAIVQGHPAPLQTTENTTPAASTVLPGIVLPPMPVRREIGDVAVAGPAEMAAVIANVTAEPTTIDKLAAGERLAYNDAADLGLYLTSDNGYHLAASTNLWLTGTMVIELPLPAEFAAQATDSNIGALWLSSTGPIFVRGVLTADRKHILVPTDHFSSWFPCLRNKQAELDEYIKSEAARRAGMRKSDFDDKVLIMGTKYLKMLGDSVSDEQSQKIIQQLEARRDDIKNIAISAGEGDNEKIAAGTAEMIGKIIVDNLDDAGVASVLKKVADNIDLIKTTATEIGKAGEEGEYGGAVMTIARTFLEKQPVNETAKLVVDTVQLGCDALNDQAWQQAYYAYRDGVQRFLILKGNKIEPGDWETVKESYNRPMITFLRAKHGAGLSEEDALVMAKKMMDERLAQEATISKEEAQLRTMYTIFNNYSLKEELQKQSGLTDDMERFDHFVKKLRLIEYDLNRSGIYGPILAPTALRFNALSLLHAYSLGGEAGYEKKLLEMRAAVSRKLVLPNGMTIDFAKLPWAVEATWPNGQVRKQSAHLRNEECLYYENYREDGTISSRSIEPYGANTELNYRFTYHPNGQLDMMESARKFVGRIETTQFFDNGKLRRIIKYHPITTDSKGRYIRENNESASEIEYFKDGKVKYDLVRDIKGNGTQKRYLPDGRHWYTDYYTKNVIVKTDYHLNDEELKGAILD